MLPFLLLLACTSPPPPAPVVPSDPADALAALGLPRLESAAPLAIETGLPTPYAGYSVRPLSFEPWPGFRTSAALWLPEGPGPFPGVLVLPGHFGEGKTAGECQEVAHALAARGYAALAVDMPGVEEWDVPGRWLHFEQGAFNRAALLAGGSSALGLQVQIARRGLEALREAAPVSRMAATGASGGAVLAFWLALAEPSVEAVALASFVTIPREPGTGGCPCDAAPSWPGPDPSLLASFPVPSLWLSEIGAPPPAGLPATARYEVVAGPHSYTTQMRALALPWLDEHLGHVPPDPDRAIAVLQAPPYTPGEALRSPADHGTASILELALQTGGPQFWEPHPFTGWEWGVTRAPDCAGPPVLTLGAEPRDEAAILAIGACPVAVTVRAQEGAEGAAVARGQALVEGAAGAVLQATSALADPEGEVPLGVYAVGAWAPVTAAANLPAVLRDPARDPRALDPTRDPPWVHVPGGWWGGLDALYASALAVGDDPAALAAALRGQHSSPSPASASTTPSQSPGGE
jgi:dienelactone hydrolase